MSRSELPHLFDADPRRTDVERCRLCTRSRIAPIHSRDLVRDRYRMERALAIDHGLSLGTIEFLDSLGRRVFEEQRPLTDAQGVRVEEILEERGR